MSSQAKQPGLARRWRIASVLVGFAVSGLSGWCMFLSTDKSGGVLALVGKLFLPGLLLTLALLRTVNVAMIVTAFLMNAMFYVLVAFFALRWWTGRGRTHRWR